MKSNAIITNIVHRQIVAESISANYALKHLDSIYNVLELYTEKKAVKADGTLVKALKDMLEEFMPSYKADLDTAGHKVTARPHHIAVQTSYSSLIFKVGNATTFGQSYFESGEQSSDDFSYYDYDLYIGKINDNNTLSLTNKEIVRARLHDSLNLSWRAIKKQRHDIRELKKQIAELEKDLPYFARKISIHD